MVLTYLRVDFWQWIDEIDPQLSSTAFSNPICWNREKEKTKTKNMMGWIENGPKKKWRRFFVRQQLPAKTEKARFRFISFIFVIPNTSLTGLLSPPKCNNFFRVDTSLRVPPIDTPLSQWVNGISGQTNILADSPFHVGHGNAIYYGIGCRIEYLVVMSLRKREDFWVSNFRDLISEVVTSGPTVGMDIICWLRPTEIYFI